MNEISTIPIEYDAPGWNIKTEEPAPAPSKVERPQPERADFQFHRPDTTLFATLPGLQMQSGVPIDRLRRLALKELADNALDAADAAGRPGRIEQIDTDCYAVEDRGNGMAGSPAEIASLFGLRIATGTVSAIGGTIKITTLNHRMVLRPLKMGKTETISTEAVDHPTGTMLVVTFGPKLPSLFDEHGGAE